VGLLSTLRRALGREEPPRAVTRTPQEWREVLTAEQHKILRGNGTERPFSAPPLIPGPSGAFACAGCGAVLFDAATKYDSGTGWPSFADARDDVELRRDFSMLIPRTEVRCRRCGSHLGHVFGDGPRPTGQRYCINAAALLPADEA
jgi:peptide-methionine (R)-S-oxide reductase